MSQNSKSTCLWFWYMSQCHLLSDHHSSSRIKSLCVCVLRSNKGFVTNRITNTDSLHIIPNYISSYISQLLVCLYPLVKPRTESKVVIRHGFYNRVAYSLNVIAWTFSNIIIFIYKKVWAYLLFFVGKSSWDTSPSWGQRKY